MLYHSHKLAMFLSVLCAISFSLNAEYLPIQNPGFEDQALAENSGVANAINAWSITGSAGLYNWNSSALTDEAPEGNNVAYLNAGGQISQILLDDLQADSVYSLIVEVGDRAGTNFGGYTIELRAGLTTLATISHKDPGTPIPPDLGFTTVTLNYVVLPNDPSIGDSLNIIIASPGTQTEIDAIRLCRLDYNNAIINQKTDAHFASIQAAIDAASEGDTIDLPQHTFHEHINLKGKAITLQNTHIPQSINTIDGRFINTISGSPEYTSLDGPIILCNSGETENTILNGIACYNSNGLLIGVNNRQGGSLYVDNASPTFENCVFRASRVDRGGGAMLKSCNSIFTNCHFSANTAISYGGGIYLTNQSDITLIDCDLLTNSSFINGAGIHNVASKVTVTDSFFQSNSATSDGGAIANDSGKLTITNTFFGNNGSYDQGGAIANLDTTMPVRINNCTFVQNFTTYDGGAIFNYRSSDILISNSKFQANYSVSDDGGAIMNFDNSSPTINNCLFTYNSAQAGGAIMNEDDSSPTITNSNFLSNTANSAAAIMNFPGANTLIAYCTFIGNNSIAGNGGAISNAHNNSVFTNIKIDHCLFAANHCQGVGSAINISRNTNTTVTHCTFAYNTTPTKNAVIYTIGSNLIMKNSIIYHNDVTNGLALSHTIGATLDVTYSNIQDGFIGLGNIDADPLFIQQPNDGGDGYSDNPATAIDESANDTIGNLRVSANSPVIDAADSLFSNAVDLDNTPRAIDTPLTPNTGAGPIAYVDMGVYEFDSSSNLLGDLNDDHTVNMLDLVIFAHNWLATNDIPVE